MIQQSESAMYIYISPTAFGFQRIAFERILIKHLGIFKIL